MGNCERKKDGTLRTLELNCPKKGIVFNLDQVGFGLPIIKRDWKITLNKNEFQKEIISLLVLHGLFTKKGFDETIKIWQKLSHKRQINDKENP